MSTVSFPFSALFYSALCYSASGPFRSQFAWYLHIISTWIYCKNSSHFSSCWCFVNCSRCWLIKLSSERFWRLATVTRARTMFSSSLTVSSVVLWTLNSRYTCNDSYISHVLLYSNHTDFNSIWNAGSVDVGFQLVQILALAAGSHAKTQNWPSPKC